MTKKLKLKRKFKVIIILIIFLIICSAYGYNEYQNYKYEQTTKFKLLETGYTEDEIKILQNNFNDDFVENLIDKEKNEVIFELLEGKYYIAENYEKYALYLDENPKTEINDLIQIINTNLDERFYEKIFEADLNQENLVLVNKYYQLSEDYVPENLVIIGTKYSWGEEGSQKCTEETFDAFINMHTAIFDELGIYLMVSSSYRSYSDQFEVYEDYKLDRGERYADSIAARPGHSEHQTGLALDIFSTASSNREEFVNSQAYTWLKNNAHLFGFILRYPENKTEITGYEFESWHYRYVGTDVAAYIFENDITYDEYYAYYVNK